MLDPENRQLLFDALRPPEGHALDVAVGTTYSLDLMALLLTPMAFAMFEQDESGDADNVNPLALLEAVRRHADRTTIFCHAGAIAVPGSYRPALAFAEDCVVEVQPRQPGRLFHPKVWVLRFATADSSPGHHRLLCLSRNLTFDRSWDTAVVLDEVTSGGAHPDIAPLTDFLASLPRMTLRPLPRDRKKQINSLIQTLRDVSFALPDGFDELRFWPLGISRKSSWPFPATSERSLVVSPFLDPGLLARLPGASRQSALLSRPESLDRAGQPALSHWSDLLVLDPAAANDEIAEAAPAPDVLTEDAPRGLHAKTYVIEADRRGRVWTGSANATSAAFDGNVEFLVELGGPARSCGVNAFLQDRLDPPTLRSITMPWTAAAEPTGVPDEEQVIWHLESLAQQLATHSLTVTVGDPESDARYPLALSFDPLDASEDGRAWPITLPADSHAVPLDLSSGELSWGLVSLEAITPFVAVELTATAPAGDVITRGCVLRAELVGAPAKRRLRMLSQMLRTQRDVLRYLLFLLADAGGPAGSLALAAQSRSVRTPHDVGETAADIPLLESLVRSVSREPETLDRVHRLINDLQDTEEGSTLIPAGFLDIWTPIWAAAGRAG
jgi:hypothetical protein